MIASMRDGDMVLRELRPGDEQLVSAIIEEPDVKRWWGDGDWEREHGFVIEVDGQVAGWLQYEEESYEWYPSVAFDISLTTELHGRGYGRRALRLAVDHFVSKGHHRFTIDPNASNERAIRAYRGAGFEPVGVLRAYERSVDGGWNDALLMDLIVLPERDG
jgi:aminoglycoside 6'-N-acetyltransferase